MQFCRFWWIFEGPIGFFHDPIRHLTGPSSPFFDRVGKVIAKAEAQIPKGLNPDLVEEARFCHLE